MAKDPKPISVNTKATLEFATMLILAQFISYRYPEDNVILGIFSTSELAEQAIKDAMEDDKIINPEHPARYQQNRNYYFTETLTIDEYNFFSIAQNRRESN